ncbi:hypothetical protein K493DRAFT_313122 [Basidiobolus meristosporus CBS 931.73]|uniref:HMG box domain-containing protein n=1 Tax=Basidiobolus meristosporus CBS 931.73 TaxID=1314790 RepID=A0A1Y1YP48_9FUNG|nr:hypothetical protein K493DRAFT_313122 [Basidiobolus meristosporus CBS 931.73]|eukprot:ORX99748.1 hypothetical protein K493DRAFT_313122 [Basidiobolus meristosporus CBS 931.73]
MTAEESDISSESSYVGSVDGDEGENEDESGDECPSIADDPGFGLFLREKRFEHPQEALPELLRSLKTAWTLMSARERHIYDERARLLSKHRDKEPL